MGVLSVIIVVLLIGAFLGFVFSGKGGEGAGAVNGAKKAGGCLVSFFVLLVIAIVIIAVLLSV